MQKAKDITEIVKNLAQVIAILIAGIWTYYTFGQKEAPDLEPRADVNGTLSWQNSGNNKSCNVIYNVVFKNNGNSSYNITKALIKGWIFEKKSDSISYVKFLDVDEICNSDNEVFSRVFEKGNADSGKLIPFMIRFTPGSSYNYSFEWDIKNYNDKWIMFRIEFFKDGESDPSWMTSSWDRICNSEETEKE